MNLVCPDCNNPVEIIKACGCQDYFCNHCNLLVSKKKVIDLDLMDSVKQGGDSLGQVAVPIDKAS